MSRKKKDNLWIPCLIITIENRWLEGWIFAKSIENSQNQLRMIIDEKYKINENEIISVSDALMEIGTPTAMCVN